MTTSENSQEESKKVYEKYERKTKDCATEGCKKRAKINPKYPNQICSTCF